MHGHGQLLTFSGSVHADLSASGMSGYKAKRPGAVSESKTGIFGALARGFPT